MAPTSAKPLEPLPLLGELVAHDVEFIVIGGFALAAHGYVRGTKDVDVFPEPSEANITRLYSALVALDAQPSEVEGFRPEELPVELGVEGLLAGENWILGTRFGRLDVMQFIEGYEDYGQLKAGAVSQVIEGVAGEVLFVGYEDLVGMKRRADRPQDRIDIVALEQARADG